MSLDRKEREILHLLQTEGRISNVELAERVGNCTSISAVFLIGSSARQEWHQSSDIDIRFLRTPGIASLISAWITLTTERFRAFLMRQPLDLFLLDKWPREDGKAFREEPICIYGELPEG